ncbi:MAG: hypothetical protein KDC54_07290, partial [Lewinella sp.]|nr:hypothetical protein [Lewinella sp.]
KVFVMLFSHFRPSLLWSFVFFSGMVLTGHAQNTEIRYLSGPDFEHPVSWDFLCSEGRNSGEWMTIPVPSQWELAGFGEYTYGRWYKELNLEEPSMEEGSYRYRFSMPPLAEGQSVSLVFGGVMTDTEVTLNSQAAGPRHQGGFYQFRYDVSDLISGGADNLLEVQVHKHSANASVNAAERKADWWLFGGIYRPVWLEISPATHIAYAAIDARADGHLTADLELANPPAHAAIRAQLRRVGMRSGVFTRWATLPDQDATPRITLDFSSVQAWTPETPYLYDLTLELMQGERVLHRRTERIGFRTLEFRKDDGIYLNGTRLVMKGVDRHTFWPESGRSTSKRISLMDAQLIKDMNMNAVRNHYPPDPHFLDACDSLGILVLDELAGWQNGYDTIVGERLIREMVRRDVNHPSVIIWDHGNEGGWNEALDHLFYELDPQQRIVIHPWSDYDGWDTHHYPTYQTGVHRFVAGEHVFFPTETMHGTYDNGHGAGLEDFWNHYLESPLFAGAFLWVFSDEAVRRSDWTGERQYDGVGSLAPDGILGPHREKEGSFFTVRDIWAPIQFGPRLITEASFDGSFLISNTYLFTDLNTCQLSYRVLRADPAALYQPTARVDTLDAGQIPLPAIAPGETRRIQIPLAEDFFTGDWLEIQATDQHGRLINTWTWPLHKAGHYALKFMPATPTNTGATVTRDESHIVLRGGPVELTLAAATGKITGIRNEETEIPFVNGPTPIGMLAEVKAVSTRQLADTAICLVEYTGGIHSIQWNMYPDGRVLMEMIALKDAGRSNGFDGAFFEDQINSFGITFDFPEEGVEGIRLLGRGPYHVWKNRIRGTYYGLWDKPYNNTITGESYENMIYPEFKGYYANFLGAHLQAGDHGFRVCSASEQMFLRLFTPAEPQYALPGSYPQPDFPAGNLSFMYEIPAMRSFKDIPHHGPHSQPTNIRIKQGDEGIQMNLWFDFRGE